MILAVCKPGAPAPSAKPIATNTKKFSYNFSRQVPDLRYLPVQLDHFAYQHLADELGLDKRLQESARDLDDVLKRFLVADEDRCDIFTFGCVAIRAEHTRGTLAIRAEHTRVRARPFPDDQFHGTNPQVSDFHRVSPL